MQGPGGRRVDWTQAESSAFPPGVPGARNGSRRSADQRLIAQPSIKIYIIT